MASKLYVADKTLFLLREYLDDVELRTENEEQMVELYEQVLELEESLYKGITGESHQYIPCQIIGNQKIGVYDIILLNDLDTGNYIKVKVMSILNVDINENGELVINFIGKSLYE